MKALIVVDMLNDFIDEKGALFIGPGGRDIIAPIAEKIRAARENGDIVMYLCDAHDEDDLEFKRFPVHAVAGTWGAQIIPELEPDCDLDVVINKSRYSGFFETDLEFEIGRDDIEAVEVVGCCTSICVAGTVEELVNRDYPVTIDRTAVADFNQDAHNFFLEYQFPNIFGVTVK